MKSSNSDLLTFFEAMQPWWQINQREYQIAGAQAAEKTSYAFQEDFYIRVCRKIYVYALTESAKQLQIARKELKYKATLNIPWSICTNVYTTIYGQLCKHCCIDILK